MIEIFMTLDGTKSSVLCAHGIVKSFKHTDSALYVIKDYFKNSPIPFNENCENL